MLTHKNWDPVMGSMQGYYGYSNDQSHTDRQMQDADVIQPGQCMIASMHRQQAILPLPESVTSQAHSVMCVAQCRRSWNAGRYDAGRAGHDEQHVQPAGDGPSATAGTTSHGRQHDGVWSHDATTAGIWKHEPWARCASTHTLHACTSWCAHIQIPLGCVIWHVKE